MKQVSYNELTELTGKSYRTLKKKLYGLTPVGKGKSGAKLWDSIQALERIYASTNGTGGHEGGQDEVFDLSQERAMLAREQREKVMIENAEKKKQLIPADKVKEVWARIVVAVKTQLLALPDRLAQLLEASETVEDRRALIDSEVKTILDNLSGGVKDVKKNQDK